MKWLAIPLFCVAAAFGQQAQPNHIKQDIIGESVDQYVNNNPVCAFVSDPEPSRIQPRQRERTVLCVPFDDLAALNKLEPNSSYEDIPLKTVDTTFLDKDGLVSLSFELKRKDFDPLKAHLFTEFGLPGQVSHFNGETITWDNGLSRIDLQQGDSGDDISYLFLSQDDYLWKSIVFYVANGQVGNNQVTVNGDFLVLQGTDNTQIKIGVLNR